MLGTTRSGSHPGAGAGGEGALILERPPVFRQEAVRPVRNLLPHHRHARPGSRSVSVMAVTLGSDSVAALTGFRPARPASLPPPLRFTSAPGNHFLVSVFLPSRRIVGIHFSVTT